MSVGLAVAMVMAPTAALPAATPGTASGPVQFMQVVAHPDDDLFFMNPDVYQTIQSGFATVTVYTTASEISGNGNTPGQKARSLQRGVEDAYARMAGVADADPNAQEEWTGQAWTIGTRQVEKYTLRDRPNVQLVFMNLHDAQLGNVYDAGLVDSTVIPTGGTVTKSYRYAKADVTSVLTSIITSYQPSVLRYQDTSPDVRYRGDHTDHFATARFVTDASARYTGPLTQVTYRDYNIDDGAPNLSAGAISPKMHFFQVYSRYDGFATPAGWLERMYYRWPRGTQWLARRSDGRPQAFLVRNGNVNTVWQAADGTWPPARTLTGTGGPVAPAISTITNSNGTIQAFARRLNDHHLITIKQTAPGGDWPASWTDLSNPNIQFGGDPSQVGVPTVAINANGSLWVFVKDGGGGVCGKRQNTAGGSWGPWLDLGGGAAVQDGLAAIRGSDGRVELVAGTTQNVLTWRQSAPNGDMIEDGPLPAFAGLFPASTPSITVNHDGTLEVIYREGGTSNMVTTFESAVGGPWNPNPVTFGGQGGVGQPALLTAPPGADARIMVFERNDTTGVSMTKQQAPDSPYEAWTNLGGTIVDYPAATTDATGAVYVFAIGADGRLYVRKQSSPGANSPFAAWQALE